MFSSVRVDVTPLLQINVYLLKINAKAFGNGRQDVYNDTEINLGSLAVLLKLKLFQKQALVLFLC